MGAWNIHGVCITRSVKHDNAGRSGTVHLLRTSHARSVFKHDVIILGCNCDDHAACNDSDGYIHTHWPHANSHIHIAWNDSDSDSDGYWTRLDCHQHHYTNDL